jgi:ribosomal-protein-serine acetyltransferase
MDTNIRLTDGLVLLRPPCADDISPLTAAVRESLAELHPWMDWATEAYDESAARRWLEFVQIAWAHSTSFQFAITDAVTGQYLGNCGVNGIDPAKRLCNLSYWVRTSRAGQGFASRAARLAAHFAFETLGLVRAEIIIAADNLASQRVACHTDARCEGLMPKHMVVHADIYNAVMYSLTPEDL